MIKTTTREIASSSDVNAPVFYFKEYVRGLEYHNNGRQIDFVTDGNSLYVPSTGNVTACKDSIKEDGGFMRLVSEGKQGIQGLKGDPGRDGRTPSVFARFDGRQMIFYTNEINEDGTPKTDDNGNPVTRRIAATNDLTGPSWRPKKVDNTIIWEKTRDDSQPESINLSDLVKETAPVIFRVDSDNTKRSDETSGPANYIQWKYEGDEYWNNLISISELMNLALAGVCIWFDETDQEYHLGHRQVLHATYDSSKSGKRIISDVEHGDVLYDAGPIHLPDFEADIAALWEEVCALKDRVDAIEEELPKFVKAVIINDKLNKPDEDGVVDLGDYSFYTKEESDERFQPKGDYQPAGDYIKKSDLKFEVRNEEGGRFLYVSFENGAPGTWTKIYEATCVCRKEEDPTVYYTIFFETPTPSTATMTYSGTVKYPGSQVRVPAGTTVILEADAERYEHYKEIKLINADYHFAPVLTEESAPEVKYSACVRDETGLADKIYIGTTSANKQQECLENLSDGTTVRGKATRRRYKDKTVSGTINGDNLTLRITGDWIREVDSFNITEGTESNPFEICLSEGTHIFSVNPSTDVKWISNDREYLTINENTGKATLVAVTPQYVIVKAQSTIDSSVEARCKVIIKDCTEPETTLSVNPTSLSFDKNSGNKTFTVITNVDDYNVEPECDWITFTKSEKTVTINVSANTGSTRTCNVKVTAGDKEVSISVSQDSGEVVPTPTYTVTATAASCNPSITIVGVSTSENGPFESSLPVNKGESPTIFAKATRSGYEDRIISQQVSENNPTITIGCSGWQEIEPERPKLTITSTDTPTGYSIKVRENFGTWNTITLTNNKYSGYYEDDTHIEILAEKAGYHTNITTTTSGISDPTEFDMIKETSINIKWVEDTPEYIRVERIDISGEPSGNITLDCKNTQTYQLTATVYPTNASNKDINWHSIDESIATVSNTGNVTILSDGEVHIYANGADNVNGHVTLTIVRPAVTLITLNQTNLTLGQDHEEDDVVITGYEPDCAAVTGNYEYYSNDENVAEVTKYGGHVTAKHNGDCTITAYCYTTSGSPVTATCAVHVQDLGPVYVYRTNVTGPDSINSGDCDDSIGASLERKRTDSDTWETVIQDLSNKAGFSWRVENTTQAHVEGQHTLCVDSGVLQDLHIQLYGDYSTTEYPDVTSGHCDIDGIAEGCIINSLSLNNSTLNLTVGGSSSTLVATVNASPACTSSDKTVTWQSSSPSVATVSSNGVVTPIAAGSTTITATCGDVTATCNVTVTPAYTIDSIRTVYYDEDTGNPVTQSYPVRSQSISLPTWSAIQFGVISNTNPEQEITVGSDFIGSNAQGPSWDGSGQHWYCVYDMYCIDNEEPQNPIFDSEGVINFGDLQITINWNTNYGRIYSNQGNPYAPIRG